MFIWCLSFNASRISSLVGARHDLQERTTRLLSEATDIPTENVASVEGLSSYELTLVMRITDRGMNFCFPLARVTSVQKDVQESLGFRTEDYI